MKFQVTWGGNTCAEFQEKLRGALKDIGFVGLDSRYDITTDLTHIMFSDLDNGERLTHTWEKPSRLEEAIRQIQERMDAALSK